MKVKTNVIGKERKQLVTVVSEMLGAKAEYQGMPTAAYTIKNITITKAGELVWGEFDEGDAEILIEGLMEAGYDLEIEKEEPIEDSKPTESGIEETVLTVSLPLEAIGAGNLTNLLEAKGTLIKKALGIEETPIIIEEDKVSFPWFSTMPEPDEVNAYTQFIAALCKMSISQKRISSTEKATDNEKYAFRCFLLRLGFIGEDYKKSRKILLKNLSGSSAFKNGIAKEVSNDEISE